MFARKLTSAHLDFEAPRIQDAGVILKNWAADAVVTKYLQWSPHTSVASVERYVAQCEKRWLDQQEFTWLIRERTGRDPIGAIAVRVTGHRAELGYVLGKAWWGQGYMTEAVAYFTQQCFCVPALSRVWAYCDFENKGSARVLEKAGMRREGLLRGWAVHPNVAATPRDCWAFARLKGDR